MEANGTAAAATGSSGTNMATVIGASVGGVVGLALVIGIIAAIAKSPTSKAGTGPLQGQPGTLPRQMERGQIQRTIEPRRVMPNRANPPRFNDPHVVRPAADTRYWPNGYSYGGFI